MSIGLIIVITSPAVRHLLLTPRLSGVPTADTATAKRKHVIS